MGGEGDSLRTRVDVEGCIGRRVRLLMRSGDDGLLSWNV